MTQSSEKQKQSLTQAEIDPLRQGQKLNAVMQEAEGKRGKPGAKNKAETPQAKLFPLTSATLPK